MDEQHLVSRKQEALAWFKQLQHLLTERLEQLEIQPEGRFEWQSWTRPGGGGGTMALLRGETFEKAGVNVSEVHGTLSPAFAREIPGASEDPSFWAAGISVVVHPRNPQVPAAHMNTRLMITRQSWWGGGGDLTPMAPHGNPEDVRLFHGALQAACDRFDKDWYARFKAQCDAYFYIPHRDEIRGAGGIFYDQHNSQDWAKDFEFTRAVGMAFHDAYADIVTRNRERPYTGEDREYQLFRRGRYAEFNLVYDRGTRFGLQTSGNIDAILMSLPPLASWA